MTTIPRFSRKEVRQFAEWLQDHDWQYDGDDANGHSLWRYPPTGKTYKLPETPKNFNLQANRKRCAALMGVDLGGKRKAKVYQPKKATPTEALTTEQLHRTIKVIRDTCDGMANTSSKAGHPQIVLQVIEQVKNGVVDQVRKYA